MFAVFIDHARRPRSLRASGERAADVAERAIVLLVYIGLVARLVRHALQTGQPANLLLLISEGLIVVFLVLRRPATQISTNWREWAAAFAATLAPLLVYPSAAGGLAPPTIGAVLLVAGMVIQVHAKLTLGRSFGCVPAHRGLKLAGPYRFVRHPMYAGYLISHAAFLLMNPALGNAAIYAVCYALQISRIFAEERLLAGDPRYREYQRVVPYRLILGVF
ncbi:MAG TPA: methyltransferase [Pirellulales bacterium]|nr:methyltransferase [Pirellulales bacterium]